jgi:hypothetical protein
MQAGGPHEHTGEHGILDGSPGQLAGTQLTVDVGEDVLVDAAQPVQRLDVVVAKLLILLAGGPVRDGALSLQQVAEH